MGAWRAPCQTLALCGYLFVHPQILPGRHLCELRALLVTPPPRGGSFWRPCLLVVFLGFCLLPWLCDGTVGSFGGTRSPLNLPSTAVCLCVYVPGHHVRRRVSASLWGNHGCPDPTCSGRSFLGRPPPLLVWSSHSLFIGCFGFFTSFIAYFNVFDLPRTKTTKNVLELLFVGDTTPQGSWVLVRQK